MRKPPYYLRPTFWYRLSSRLIRDAIYPGFGIAAAEALVNPQATLSTCLIVAFILLSFVYSCAGLCFLIGMSIERLDQ